MKNKLNIDEIKQLLPDYITGSLSIEEAELVESAVKSNPEIEALYSDMKSALEFVESVKFEEPVPQYWNNLLPKIHEKIESRGDKKFFRNPVPLIWKILVPVAAVILIAIIYRIATSPENQITKDITPNIQKEKPVEQQQQKQFTEQQKTVDTINNSEKNIKPVKVQKNQTLRNYKVESSEPENKENIAQHDEEIQQKENNFLADLSSDEINDLSEINSVEANSNEEELDNEIQNLNNNEKEALLKELENSNM